ncbi:hypothetical protein QCA50_015868 [Cerrena zonata]|uniref:Uncharacterized protein n=1 Tax=Cerrena zonata TaxID=2478898 RepID=A0AAW0FUM6_9APHY
MSLVQLYVPAEVSRDIIYEIGQLNLIQFRDLNSKFDREAKEHQYQQLANGDDESDSADESTEDNQHDDDEEHEEHTFGSDTKKNKQNQQQNGKKHKKGKKNQSAVPLADILSHQHLFKDSVPDATIKAVRQFLSSIITKVNLPPTQYYKIMRYIIIEAVQIQKLNYDSSVPNELKTLLINSVLYPSNEKVSLLPLVSAIIGDDPLLSVFNNPRFPPLPKFIPKVIDEIEDDEEEEEEEQDEQDEDKPTAKRESEDTAEANDIKRPKVDNSISGTGYNATDDTSAPEIPRDEVEIKQDSHQDKLFTNTQINPDQIIQFAQPKAEILKSEPVPEKDTTEKPVIETKVTETQVVTQAVEDDGDSDFEMPQLDADDSDDE